MKKGIYIFSWIFAALLAFMFLIAGAGKLVGGGNEMFAEWGYPAWFAIFIGVAEVAGAIGILVPKLMRPAIIGLTLIMLGGAYTHISAGEGLQVLRPLIFLVFLWLTWFMRGYGTADNPAESAESE